MLATIATAQTTATLPLGMIVAEAARSRPFALRADSRLCFERGGAFSFISAAVLAEITPRQPQPFAACHILHPTELLVLFLALLVRRRRPHVRESRGRQILPRSWRDDDPHRFLRRLALRCLHI